MRAILCFIVFVNILRVTSAPVPVELDWSKASDYHAQGSDGKVPDGKYMDSSQEVQNIKNAHALGNKYIESMEKVVNDPHKEEHKRILVHNFGEHHDIDQIKEGVKKLKEGKISVNHVHKQGVSGKASMGTSGSSAGLVTFKSGFHKLKTDDDRAGTFVHEASHALVGTLDRFRMDSAKGHLVPITKKKHKETPGDQKVVMGYLKDKQIHELLQDPNMKTQMHKNADSWKAFGHHAFHGEAHPLHPIKKKTEAVASEVSKNHKRPRPDDDKEDGSSHGNAKRPKVSGESSKAPSTTEGKTKQTVPPKAGSSNTRQKSNKLPESSKLKLKTSSTVRHSTKKNISTVKKTASSHSSLTKSTKPRLTKQSSSKSTSQKTVLSSKKSKTSGRPKSTAKVQKGASKATKSVPATRKKSPAATRQKSKTSHVQASASSLKQKKISSKVPLVKSKSPSKSKLPSRKAVATRKIKQAVGANKKHAQKPSSKAPSRPKVSIPSKPQKQVLPKVHSQKQLSNKIPSTSRPAPKMQHIIKSKGRK